MPIRWTEQNKLLLFQKVLEQAPNFKVDYQAICDSWPGSDAPTYRAIQDQWQSCKKALARNTNSTTSSPNTRNLAKPITQKQTPTTPLKRLSLTSSNKRGNGNSNQLGSSSKKLKIKHNSNASEISIKVDKSEDEGELSDDETDENIIDSDPSPTPVTRRQPLRSRTRSKRVIENAYESTSEDGLIKMDSDNENDSDFDLKKDYESKLSPKEKAQIRRERRAEQRKKNMRYESKTEEENIPAVPSGTNAGWKGDSSSMFADISDNAEVEDDDVKSEVTKRTSWQTAPSQFGDHDEI